MAVDGTGDVLVSTAPEAAKGAWQTADVDGANALSGISCPSSSLCVAVDRAGNVLTSTDPAGDGSTWRVASLGRGRPLTTVSCASASLCVAGDTTALVSTNPTGGPAAWTDTSAGGTLYYSCQHYGDNSPSCNAPLTAVSCLPAPVQCVTFNDAGESAVSTNPGGGASQWRATGPAAGELLGGSCMSHQLCVAVCPLGVSAGSGECQGSGGYEFGSVLAWDPQSPQRTATFTTLSAENLTGVWCAAGGPCFTTAGAAPPGVFSDNGPGSGELFVSTNPAATRQAWTSVYHDPSGITSIACPSTLCLGVDAAGNLLTGDRPATTPQIKRSLGVLLKSMARRKVVVQRDRVLHATFGINAPANGTLKITWLTTESGHHHPRRQVTIATSRAGLSEGTTSHLTMRLNRLRAPLLRAGRRPSILAIAKFAEPDGTTLTQQRRFTLLR